MRYNRCAIHQLQYPINLGYQNTNQTDYTKALTPGPMDIGFDYHWGVPNNNGDISGVWVEDAHTFGLEKTMEAVAPERRQPETNWQGRKMLGIPAPFRADTETTTVINQRIDKWIDAQSKEKPFFLYYPMPAIHAPISPSDEFVGTSNGGPYGDFIQEMDASVASVLKALERNNFTENTIVIFTSDNGGHPAGGKEAIKAGLKINGDLRGTKLTVFDGGFKVPLIVKWPGKIEKQSSSNELVNLVDIYATLMEIVHKEMAHPKKEAGDSYSFYPALIGDPKQSIRDNMIYASFEGIVALQVDGWKYIEGK